ncbi:hypothetical protein BDZ89DRAFT_1060005 [Hymenopellis radicata]|nr:hypothetical protein BDZ89DRAFT_1060005 [Hymenopellis radicata]
MTCPDESEHALIMHFPSIVELPPDQRASDALGPLDLGQVTRQGLVQAFHAVMRPGINPSQIDSLGLMEARRRLCLQASLSTDILPLNQTRRVTFKAPRSIHSLPTELLLKVFENVFDEFTLNSMGSGPWLLSRVCARWASIVRDSPDLWTRFHIPASPVGPKAVVLLKLVVYLAALRPLSIRYEAAPTVAHRDLFAGILTLSKLWKAVNFRLVEYETITWLTRVRGRVPRLEAVEIRAPIPPDAAARAGVGLVVSGMPAFAVAPRLRRVTLQVDSHIFHLPAHLTHYSELWSSAKLRVSPIDHHANRALVGMNMLRVLDLSAPGEYRFARAGAAYPLLRLPSLERLASRDAELLDMLVAPKLADVTVFPHSRTNDGSIIRAIHCLVDRSGCHLRSLAMNECSFQPLAFVELLKSMPELEKLSIWVKEIWDQPMDGILVEVLDTIKTQVLIPKLTDFMIVAFEGSARSGFPIAFWRDALVNMVDARRSVLKWIRVYVAASLRGWSISPGKDNLLRWKLMKAQGLDVQISVICARDAENCSYTTGHIAYSLGSNGATIRAKNYV